MPAIIILFLGSILLTIGDVIFKFWVEKTNPILYISGILFYFVGLLFLVESYKTENIGVAGVILVLFNTITLLLVSWLYFKEPLSMLQVGAMCLAVISIFLLEFGGK